MKLLDMWMRERIIPINFFIFAINLVTVLLYESLFVIKVENLQYAHAHIVSEKDFTLHYCRSRLQSLKNQGRKLNRFEAIR